MTDDRKVPTTPWPAQRSRRSAIIAQFGEDRADLVHWALVTGDPLMDAVVNDIHGERPEARAALRKGLVSGLAALEDAPDSVRALLQSAESCASYVDDELLDNGSRPFFSSIAQAHMVSLSAGALIRVYESPSIAAVLDTTGRLVDGADRRITETGKWLITMMLPGALRVGQPGYIATLQVRLLHANMRRVVRQRGYDEAGYGAPINQVDLARTWMDFTLTSFAAEEKMGFALTGSETAQLYRYWWHAGHLLGIDPSLIEGIASNDQAKRVDDLMQAVTGPLIPESQALAKATIASIAAELRTALRLPETIGTRALGVLARRFHGDAMANELQIPRDGVVDAIIGKAINLNARRRQSMRNKPDDWNATIASNIAAARDAIGQRTEALYESNA